MPQDTQKWQSWDPNPGSLVVDPILMTARPGPKAHKFGHTFPRAHSAEVSPKGHSTAPCSKEVEGGGKVIILKCIPVQEAESPQGERAVSTCPQIHSPVGLLSVSRAMQILSTATAL